MYHPSRGGVRGGRDQFNWDDVKGDKHRENYLGHSIKAPVGRWQKGKDLNWYARDKNADEEAAARDEIQRLKEEEEEAMQEMLGLAPKKSRRQLGQMDPREMSEVLKKVKSQDVEESGPSYAAGERVEGLGFAPVPGQTMSRQAGREQIGTKQPVPVTFEKVPALTTGQRNEEFSGDEVERHAKNDGPRHVEPEVATRLENEDKTSSTSSEEEGVASRKRKSEKRRAEQQTNQRTRKKSKGRESEEDVIAHNHRGARGEGKWKVRYSREDLESSRGHTGRRDSRQIKDQSKRDYLSNDRRYRHVNNARHDSESSEENLLEKARRTTAHRNAEVRSDSRSHHRRNNKSRHDRESSEEILLGNGRRPSAHPNADVKGDSGLHHSRNNKSRHDSDNDKETDGGKGFRHGKVHLPKDRHDDLPIARGGSEESLQETARRTSLHSRSQLRRDLRSNQSRNGKLSHDGDNEKEAEGTKGDSRWRSYGSDSVNGREGRRGDTRKRRQDSDSDDGREGRRGDIQRRRHDSDDGDDGREGRRRDTQRRRHDSDSDDGIEGRRVDSRRRHDSVSDNEREGKRGDTRPRRHDSSDDERERRRDDPPRSSVSYKEHGKRKLRHDSD